MMTLAKGLIGLGAGLLLVVALHRAGLLPRSRRLETPTPAQLRTRGWL